MFFIFLDGRRGLVDLFIIYKSAYSAKDEIRGSKLGESKILLNFHPMDDAVCRLVSSIQNNIKKGHLERDYTLGGPPSHGPPSCEAPRQPTIHDNF